jgi:hypothetical protein
VEERSEGKRPLVGPRRRWEDNIKTDIQEVGCGGLEWIDLAQDAERCGALMNELMNLRISSNAGNFLTICEPLSISGMILLGGVSWSVS